MNNSLVATLVLLLVALLGARLSFSTEHVSPGPRLLFRTGTHFLLVGFLLGPSVLGLLTPEATRGLFPFLALGLGWVGFHFGLQLDFSTLRRFPVRDLTLALGQALLTFVIFASGAYGIATALGVEDTDMGVLILAAACTAAVTTPAGIGMISSTFSVKGRVRDLLFLVASLDALVGIVALQVLYSLYRPDALGSGPGGLGDLSWIGVAAGLGVVLGMVFVWLTRPRPTSEELALYLLGFSAFASGTALLWGVSPLFVAVTMGAVVANAGTANRLVLPLLQRWEKMVYVTFLLLAGALLQIATWWVFPIAVGYAALRMCGKFVGTAVMTSALRYPRDVPRGLGLGLVPQGGISIAMAASGVLMYSGLEVAGVEAVPALFTVIVLGVVLSELGGPLMTMRLLTRAGELDPEARSRVRARTTPEAATGGDAAPADG